MVVFVFLLTDDISSRCMQQTLFASTRLRFTSLAIRQLGTSALSACGLCKLSWLSEWPMAEAYSIGKYAHAYFETDQDWSNSTTLRDSSAHKAMVKTTIRHWIDCDSTAVRLQLDHATTFLRYDHMSICVWAAALKPKQINKLAWLWLAGQRSAMCYVAMTV